MQMFHCLMYKLLEFYEDQKGELNAATNHENNNRKKIMFQEHKSQSKSLSIVMIPSHSPLLIR